MPRRSFLERHGRVILFLTLIIAVIIMIVDFVICKFRCEMIVFYALTLGILLFRLFGVSWITRLLHFIIYVTLLVSFYWLQRKSFEYQFYYFSLLVPFALQFIISLHLVFFRSGRSKSERACRVGVHALLGIICAIIFFWVVAFLKIKDQISCMLEMSYMFFFLFIVLTPQFQTERQAVVLAEAERRRQRRIQKKSSLSSNGSRLGSRSSSLTTTKTTKPRTTKKR